MDPKYAVGGPKPISSTRSAPHFPLVLAFCFNQDHSHLVLFQLLAHTYHGMWFKRPLLILLYLTSFPSIQDRRTVFLTVEPNLNHKKASKEYQIKIYLNEMRPLSFAKGAAHVQRSINWADYILKIYLLTLLPTKSHKVLLSSSPIFSHSIFSAVWGN